MPRGTATKPSQNDNHTIILPISQEQYDKNPTAGDIISAMEHIANENDVFPKHVIFDHGTQFYCSKTIDWCKSREIKPRYGAVGKHGSIAVVERLRLSMKNECTRRIIVPVGKNDFVKKIGLWREWDNSYRPHMNLKGKNPTKSGRRCSATIWCVDLRRHRHL